MLKRDKKRQNRGNTDRIRRTERKVLMKVSAFFDAKKLLIINDIYGTLRSGICGAGSSEILACFKMKIEHENMHRNNENNNPL